MEPKNTNDGLDNIAAESTLPEEDTERQGDPLQPHPHQGTIELGLHQGGLALLQLKCVEKPDCKIQEAKKCDKLTAHQLLFANRYCLK